MTNSMSQTSSCLVAGLLLQKWLITVSCLLSLMISQTGQYLMLGLVLNSSDVSAPVGIVQSSQLKEYLISASSHLFLLDLHSSPQILLAHPSFHQKMDMFYVECYLTKSFLLCRSQFIPRINFAFIPRILLNVSPPSLSSLDVSEDLLVHSFMACEQHGFQITHMFIKDSNKY